MALPTTQQKGLAQLYGIGGTPATAVTAYANLTFQPQGFKASHKANAKFIQDNLGNDCSATSVNRMYEATLELNITADTLAHAKASGVFLESLTKVTLSGFDLTWINADWLYVDGETIDLSSVDVGKMSIPIRLYVDTTQNTLMTTASS